MLLDVISLRSTQFGAHFDVFGRHFHKIDALWTNATVFGRNFHETDAFRTDFDVFVEIRSNGKYHITICIVDRIMRVFIIIY